MTDFKNALLSPTSFYKVPDEVVHDESLSLEQKIGILRQWEYDARDMLVAEEENMIGDSSSSMLSRVLIALKSLGFEECGAHSSPTKQGGEDH
jgi:hypothetical protein